MEVRQGELAAATESIEARTWRAHKESQTRKITQSVPGGNRTHIYSLSLGWYCQITPSEKPNDMFALVLHVGRDHRNAKLRLPILTSRNYSTSVA